MAKRIYLPLAISGPGEQLEGRRRLIVNKSCSSERLVVRAVQSGFRGTRKLLKCESLMVVNPRSVEGTLKLMN